MAWRACDRRTKMISLEKDGKGWTENPLHSPREEVVRAIPFSYDGRDVGSKTSGSRRAVLDRRHRCRVAALMVLLFTGSFLILPLWILKMQLFQHPRINTMVLFLVCAIFQASAVMFIVSKQTYAGRSFLRNRGKILLFAFAFVVSLTSMPMPSIANVHAESKAKETVSLGNCSWLENIPHQLSGFNNPIQKERQHMLYDSGRNFGFSLPFKYQDATLEALETIGKYVWSETRESECLPVLFRASFYSVFAPCNQNCTAPDFICNEACNTSCTAGISDTGFDADKLWVQAKSLVAPILSPIFTKLYSVEKKGEIDRWAEESFKLILAAVTQHIRDVRANKCRSRTDINGLEGASCMTYNGVVYESRAPPAKETSSNCSMSHMYALETKQAFHFGAGNQETFRAIQWVDLVLILTFYVHSCHLLFVWGRLKEKRTANSSTTTPKAFVLSMRTSTFTVFLGMCSVSLGWVIFVKIYVSVCKIYETPDLNRNLRIVYILLTGSILITQYVGLSFIFTGFARLGTMEHRQKNKTTRQALPVKLYHLYQSYTNPRTGRYFSAKMLFWETLEVAVQGGSLYMFAASKSVNYVLVVSIVLCLNFSITPFVFSKSVYSPDTTRAYNNGLVLVTDTLVDLTYFGVNLWFLLPQDVYSKPLVATTAILWPVFCAMMRFRSLGRLVTVRTQSREIEAPPLPRIFPSFRTQCNCVCYCLTLTLIGSHCRKKFTKGLWACLFMLGCIQLLFLSVSIITMNRKCSAELGVPLWDGAYPKLVFQNGLFGPPTCAYEKITSIQASAKDIFIISPVIGKCTSLTMLDLRDNKIAELPRALLLMGEKLKTVLLSGNPVTSRLAARNMSLRGGLPAFVVNHLSHSLVELDLSDNALMKIGENISKFQKLKILRLRNNDLKPSNMAWNIIQLLDLQEFDVAGNELAFHVDWSHQAGFQSPKWLTHGVTFLNVFFFPSIKKLNLSQNAFERDHFDALASKLVHLEVFDVSQNLRLRATAANPLRLLNLTKLHFLSLGGNERISTIAEDDVFDMDTKMKSGAARYIVKGVGWNILNFGHVRSKRQQNRTFPWRLVNQIIERVNVIQIYNIELSEFAWSTSLCNFPVLQSVEYRIGVVSHLEKWKPVPFPSCLGVSMTVLRLKAPRITFPGSLNIHNLEILDIKNIDPNRQVSFPPINVRNNHSLRHLELESVSVEGVTLPVEWGYVPTLAMHAIMAGDGRMVPLPKEWSTFEFVRLTHSNIFGSIANLTIFKGAAFEFTNLEGPLFLTGPLFKCMRLSTMNDTVESFEQKWDTHCTASPSRIVDLMKNDGGKQRYWYWSGDEKISNVINCTLPPYNVQVWCAAFTQAEATSNDVVWDCFEESFFLTERSCRYGVF